MESLGKLIHHSKKNQFLLYSFNTRAFYKILYGLAAGHSIFWTITGFASYANLKQLEKGQIGSFRELYGDYAEHVAFSSVVGLGLLFGLAVHRKAGFNIQEVMVIDRTALLKNSKIFGKTCVTLDLKACNLQECSGGYNILYKNKKFFLDKRGMFLNLNLLKNKFHYK